MKWKDWPTGVKWKDLTDDEKKRILEEQLKREESRKGRRNYFSQRGEWKKTIRKRPQNYNKIKNIVMFLNNHNIPISRESILEELGDLPTIDDNEAIEFILKE